MLDLTRSTIRRAVQVRLPQVAASLTLTTALSIAPLVAVSFAVFKVVPIFRPLELAIEQHLLKSLLPADISRAVLKYLHQFAANASSLTMVGALCVLAAAVMMLVTFEGADSGVEVVAQVNGRTARAFEFVQSQRRRYMLTAKWAEFMKDLDMLLQGLVQ
jgi:YihY family inner membrane protein